MNKDSKIVLDGIFERAFLASLQGYCQNGESPQEAVSKALSVVRQFNKKSLENNGMCQVNALSDIEILESKVGLKVKDSMRYNVILALESFGDVDSFIKSNPDIYEHLK